ncbi:MAG TPA: hypothetical protein VF600_09305 [Abditibacteriaceae bacterium]|jgi:hypothetical protein
MSGFQHQGQSNEYSSLQACHPFARNRSQKKALKTMQFLLRTREGFFMAE